MHLILNCNICVDMIHKFAGLCIQKLQILSHRCHKNTIGGSTGRNDCIIFDLQVEAASAPAPMPSGLRGKLTELKAAQEEGLLTAADFEAAKKAAVEKLVSA